MPGLELVHMGNVPVRLYERWKRSKPDLARFVKDGKLLIPDNSALFDFVDNNTENPGIPNVPNSHYACFTLRGDLHYGHIMRHVVEEDHTTQLILLKLNREGELARVENYDADFKRKKISSKNEITPNFDIELEPKEMDTQSETEVSQVSKSDYDSCSEISQNFSLAVEQKVISNPKNSEAEANAQPELKNTPNTSNNYPILESKEIIPKNNNVNFDSVMEISSDVNDSSNKTSNKSKINEKAEEPSNNIKISPIVFKCAENPVAFFKEIASNCAPDFSVKIVGDWIKIFPESLITKNKIINHLKNKALGFYLTPEGIPPLRVIIRGLPKNVPTSDIETDLKDLGFEATVFQMKSRLDGRILPFVKVNLVRNEFAKKIFELRTLMFVRVTVESYRPQVKAPQCFRCQGFFHTAQFCHMNPKCVGCGENHDSQTCPRKELILEDRPPPKCCNCGEAHPANFKGCKNFPIKPQFKKSYADSVKKYQEKIANPLREKIIPRQRGVAQTQPKVNFPQPNSIYHEKELGAGFSDLIEIINKIQAELQVTSFTELANSLTAIYEEIVLESDCARKKIKFMDRITKIGAKETKASNSAQE